MAMATMKDARGILVVAAIGLCCVLTSSPTAFALTAMAPRCSAGSLLARRSRLQTNNLNTIINQNSNASPLLPNDDRTRRTSSRHCSRYRGTRSSGMTLLGTSTATFSSSYDTGCGWTSKKDTVGASCHRHCQQLHQHRRGSGQSTSRLYMTVERPAGDESEGTVQCNTVQYRHNELPTR